MGIRGDATLDPALGRLVKDLAEPYVFAARFDEDTRTYDGAIEGIVRVTDGLGSADCSSAATLSGAPSPSLRRTEPMR